MPQTRPRLPPLRRPIGRGNRTFDSLGRFLVRTIMFDMDRCRASILLADSVNASRIAIVGNVLFENLCAEGTVSEGAVWYFKTC